MELQPDQGLIRKHHNLLVRIAGPRGMSPLLGVLVLGPLSLGTLVSDPGLVVLSQSQMVLISLAAGMCSWLVFVLLGLAIRSFTGLSTTARGIAFLVAYALVEAGRACMVSLLVQSVDPSMATNWAYRLIAGGLTGLTLFALVSVVINDATLYRDTVRELLGARESIRQKLSLTEHEFAIRRDESLASVRSIVENALREISLTANKGSGSARETVAALVNISNNVIRPLSHELFELPADVVEGITVAPRITFRRAVSLATVTKPFRPEAFVVLVTLLLIGATFFGSAGVWSGLALLTIVVVSGFLVFAAARAALVPWLQRIPVPARLAIIFSVYLLYSVVLGQVLATVFLPALPGLGTLYTVVLGIPVFSFLAFTPGLERARQEVLAELLAVNAELEWFNARLGARLWNERKTIAKSLHRDVQGVLVAAAVRLERAIDDGEEAEQAMSEVRELIELATSFVVQPQTAPRVDAMLERLCTQWQGVLTVDANLDEALADSLNRDVVARLAFFEIAAEFMMNSVKHGQSRHISITADVEPEHRTLSLSMHNDGIQLSDAAQPAGLGSKMVDAMTITHELANSAGGGVLLRAELPVDAD